MLIWVASYPRSGNTFLRIVLHRLYGVPTSVIYDVDGVAERLGRDLIGAHDRPAPLDALRASDQVHLVKTHRRRDEQVSADDRAVCLVRDGRDATVSWARLRDDFPAQLRPMICNDDTRGTGSWGANVLSWLQPPAPHRIVLRYEELIREPAAAAQHLVEALGLLLRPVADAAVPSFAELHAVDPGFFRRGQVGTHRDELPDDLHRLFWSRPENAAAMALLHQRSGHAVFGRPSR